MQVGKEVRRGWLSDKECFPADLGRNLLDITILLPACL